MDTILRIVFTTAVLVVSTSALFGIVSLATEEADKLDDIGARTGLETPDSLSDGSDSQDNQDNQNGETGQQYDDIEETAEVRLKEVTPNYDIGNQLIRHDRDVNRLVVEADGRTSYVVKKMWIHKKRQIKQLEEGPTQGSQTESGGTVSSEILQTGHKTCETEVSAHRCIITRDFPISKDPEKPAEATVFEAKALVGPDPDGDDDAEKDFYNRSKDVIGINPPGSIRDAEYFTPSDVILVDYKIETEGAQGYSSKDAAWYDTVPEDTSEVRSAEGTVSLTDRGGQVYDISKVEIEKAASSDNQASGTATQDCPGDDKCSFKFDILIGSVHGTEDEANAKEAFMNEVDNRLKVTLNGFENDNQYEVNAPIRVFQTEELP